MAGVSQFNQFPCKALRLTRSHSQFSSKVSVFPASSVGFRARNSIRESTKARPVLGVCATGEYEWGGEEGSAAASSLVEPPPTETDELKKQLVGTVNGTDRGLRATSETRAEVGELIARLEGKNPTPAPTKALSLLNGKWILAYTSFVGLFPLLSSGLPLVKVEEISQTIDSENFTVENSVLFTGPYSTTAVTTNAKFEVRSPRRVQIKFEEGVIGTPQLTDSIVLPENVEFLGQKIDLAPFKGLITSVEDTASSVAKRISSQPPIKFSISNSKAESWLLTTYLDEDLRISRGDVGSVFVLIKEGSPLLTP